MRRLTAFVYGLAAAALTLSGPTTATAAGVTPGPFEGAFFTACGFTGFAQVDPIVSPGAVSEHQHMFFGAEGVTADTTHDSLRAGTTRCRDAKDRAAYWMPTLVSPSGTVPVPTGSNIYYRKHDADAGQHIYAPPADLRIVGGKASYTCGGGQPFRATPYRCDTGRPKLVVQWGSCWNGALDSPDHRSHVVQYRGGCPATHPMRLPRISMEVRYDQLAPNWDPTGWRLSSGDFTTQHADFMNGWDPARIQFLVDTCLNGNRLCGQAGKQI